MANINKENIVIGKRQLLRELMRCNVARIILATDADEDYKQSIIKAATIYAVSVVESGTKCSLAEQYDIDVGSAVVAILKAIE